MLTALEICKLAKSKTDIDAILADIDKKIEAAANKSLESAKVVCPKIVVNEVTTNLSQRGFKTKITLAEDGKVWFYVSW